MASFTISEADFSTMQDHTFEAREMVDGLNARAVENAYYDQLERRELLSDFTTRELLEELVERGPPSRKGSGGASYTCIYCGAVFNTAAAVCILLPYLSTQKG